MNKEAAGAGMEAINWAQQNGLPLTPIEKLTWMGADGLFMYVVGGIQYCLQPRKGSSTWKVTL